jgi:hypothetical protein
MLKGLENHNENNTKRNATLETARGEVRVFKRLDVAVDLLFGLGVGKV